MKNNENIIFEYDLTIMDLLYSYFILIVFCLFPYMGFIIGLCINLQMSLIQMVKCAVSSKYLICGWFLLAFFIFFLLPVVFILRYSLKVVFYDDKVVFNYKYFTKSNKDFLYKDIAGYCIEKCLLSVIGITTKEGPKSGINIFVNNTVRNKIKEILLSKVKDIKEIKDENDKPSFYIKLAVIGFTIMFILGVGMNI